MQKLALPIAGPGYQVVCKTMPADGAHKEAYRIISINGADAFSVGLMCDPMFLFEKIAELATGEKPRKIRQPKKV